MACIGRDDNLGFQSNSFKSPGSKVPRPTCSKQVVREPPNNMEYNMEYNTEGTLYNSAWIGNSVTSKTFQI